MSRRLKVLILCSRYIPTEEGGAERSTALLSEALARAGVSVRVLTLSSERKVRTEIVHGIEVTRIPLWNFFWPFGNQNRHISTPIRLLWHLTDAFNPFIALSVFRILRRNRPDLIHTQQIYGFSCSVWWVASLLKIPVVHTIRDYYLFCSRFGGSCFREGQPCNRKCLGCLTLSIPRRWLARNLTALISISKRSLEIHIERKISCLPKRTHVLHNGVALERTKPHARPLADLMTLGFIGMVEARKGFPLLISELMDIPKDRVRLLVAGHVPSDLQDEIKKNPRLPEVIFLGFVDPFSEFYPLIDILVVPSIWEEVFGRVVIEAYSQGVGVIASQRGGLTELIQNQKTGLLFNPDQPGELKNLILKLLENPSLVEKLGNHAFQAAEFFDPARIAAQQKEIYESVLATS